MEDVLDIGTLVYMPGAEPGTLEAKWYSTRKGDRKFGTGKATGGPADGLCGRYKISYFDHDGVPVGESDLEIVENGEILELFWRSLEDGAVLFRGVGQPITGGISAGWRKV